MQRSQKLKAAVEKMFEVEVDRVQVLNVMGKRKIVWQNRWSTFQLEKSVRQA